MIKGRNNKTNNKQTIGRTARTIALTMGLPATIALTIVAFLLFIMIATTSITTLLTVLISVNDVGAPTKQVNDKAPTSQAERNKRAEMQSGVIQYGNVVAGDNLAEIEGELIDIHIAMASKTEIPLWLSLGTHYTESSGIRFNDNPEGMLSVTIPGEMYGREDGKYTHDTWGYRQIVQTYGQTDIGKAQKIPATLSNILNLGLIRIKASYKNQLAYDLNTVMEVAAVSSRTGAIGPVQFMPTTWYGSDSEVIEVNGTNQKVLDWNKFIQGSTSGRGRDGNGDGIVDPLNMYDAVYSANKYKADMLETYADRYEIPDNDVKYISAAMMYNAGPKGVPTGVGNEYLKDVSRVLGNPNNLNDLFISFGGSTGKGNDRKAVAGNFTKMMMELPTDTKWEKVKLASGRYGYTKGKGIEGIIPEETWNHAITVFISGKHYESLKTMLIVDEYSGGTDNIESFNRYDLNNDRNNHVVQPGLLNNGFKGKYPVFYQATRIEGNRLWENILYGNGTASATGLPSNLADNGCGLFTMTSWVHGIGLGNLPKLDLDGNGTVDPIDLVALSGPHGEGAPNTHTLFTAGNGTKHIAFQHLLKSIDSDFDMKESARTIENVDKILSEGQPVLLSTSSRLLTGGGHIIMIVGWDTSSKKEDGYYSKVHLVDSGSQAHKQGNDSTNKGTVPVKEVLKGHGSLWSIKDYRQVMEYASGLNPTVNSTGTRLTTNNAKTTDIVAEITGSKYNGELNDIELYATSPYPIVGEEYPMDAYTRPNETKDTWATDTTPTENEMLIRFNEANGSVYAPDDGRLIIKRSPVKGQDIATIYSKDGVVKHTIKGLTLGPEVSGNTMISKKDILGEFDPKLYNKDSIEAVNNLDGVEYIDGLYYGISIQSNRRYIGSDVVLEVEYLNTDRDYYIEYD